MVDSARSGAVVDECAAWAPELMVERDRGGEAAEAREDAFAQSAEGAGAVALERQDVFAGPEDRFDPLTDRRERWPLGLGAVAGGLRRDLASGTQRRCGRSWRRDGQLVFSAGA